MQEPTKNAISRMTHPSSAVTASPSSSAAIPGLSNLQGLIRPHREQPHATRFSSGEGKKAAGSVENRRNNPIPTTSVSIFFFGENEIRFKKYRFGNGIEICGYTETNKYG
jgi:hypothetical protein